MYVTFKFENSPGIEVTVSEAMAHAIVVAMHEARLRGQVACLPSEFVVDDEHGELEVQVYPGNQVILAAPGVVSQALGSREFNQINNTVHSFLAGTSSCLIRFKSGELVCVYAGGVARWLEDDGGTVIDVDTGEVYYDRDSGHDTMEQVTGQVGDRVRRFLQL